MPACIQSVLPAPNLNCLMKLWVVIECRTSSGNCFKKGCEDGSEFTIISSLHAFFNVLHITFAVYSEFKVLSLFPSGEDSLF